MTAFSVWLPALLLIAAAISGCDVTIVNPAACKLKAADFCGVGMYCNQDLNACRPESARADGGASYGDGGTYSGPDGFRPTCSADDFCIVIPPSPARNLNGIYGTSSTDIWAVGDTGTTLHWNRALSRNCREFFPEWIGRGYRPGMAQTPIESFLDRHPSLSLNVLAAYYPLPADLLETYADELSWHVLSDNPRLNWTAELITRHREKWSESSLLRNPGIVWTPELITRLLGKQVKDEWFYLSMNPRLPVDDEFLTLFAKKINWSWLSQNLGIRWTQELLDAHAAKALTWVEGREQLLATALKTGNVVAERWAAARLADPEAERIRQQVAESQRIATTVAALVEDQDRTPTDELLARPLAQWSDAWLTELESKVCWRLFAWNPHLPWSLEFVDRYAEHLAEQRIVVNQTIWHKAFAAQLAETNVRRFLAALFPQRFIKYFNLSRATRDDHGCLPGVKAKKKFDEIADDHYWAKPKVIELEHDNIMQGPPRFADFVAWQGNEPAGCILVVSERMAQMLKSLSLPEYVTYKARVRCNPAYQRKYGKEAHAYVVFHFLRDTFLKQMDVPQTPLSLWCFEGSSRQTEHVPAGKFATAEAALAWRDQVQRARPTARVTLIQTALDFDSSADGSGDIGFAASQFPLRFAGDRDLVWLRRVGLLVSETFRKLVVAQGLTGMDFAQWGNDSIFFAGAETAEAKLRKLQLIQSAALVPATPTTDHEGEVFRALEARRDAVLAREDRIAELQHKEPAPASDRELQVQAVERKLDVRLPPAYRATWTGDHRLPLRSGWKWLALKDVFCIGDDWHQSRPEAVRAIAVASNGLGDHLGFLLKADSQTQLDDTLVEFKHESAMIEPLPRRLQLKTKSPESNTPAARAKPQDVVA